MVINDRIKSQAGVLLLGFLLLTLLGTAVYAAQTGDTATGVVLAEGEPGSNPQSAIQLNLDELLVDTISDQARWYKVAITEDLIYNQSHLVVQTYGDLDIYLEVFGSLPRAIKGWTYHVDHQDDDSGGGRNAKVEMPIAFKGPFYYLRVTAKNLSKTREFQINVSSSYRSPEKIPPGEIGVCATEAVVSDRPSGWQILLNLRTLRDGLLAKTARGEKIVELYYQASPRLLKAALFNRDLRTAIYQNLLDLQQVVEAAISLGAGRQSTYVFTAQDYQNITEIRALIATHLPEDLNDKIDVLWQEVNISSFKGKQLAEGLFKASLSTEWFRDDKTKAEYVVGELIVRLNLENLDAEREGLMMANQLLNRALVAHGVKSIEPLSLPIFSAQKLNGTCFLDQTFLVRLARGHQVNISSIIEGLNRLPEVKYAEPNYIFRLADKDIFYRYHWSLENTGQEGGKVGADINYLGLRRQLQGVDLPKTMIAVLDTGVNYHFADFVDHVRTDIDWDFINDDDDAMDDHNHGTHVTGTIVATSDNGFSMTGINSHATILPIKVLCANGEGTADGLAQGIKYAVEKGARVINLSLGTDRVSSVVEEALAFATQHNVLVVAAAGNDGRGGLNFPASSEHVFSVGATDNQDRRASFSNYGHGLDVMAPGVGILSLVLNGNVMYADGTSMAAPHVAALAGIVFSRAPVLTGAEVANIIRDGCVDLGEPGYDFEYGFGRVDAVKILAGVAVGPPFVAHFTVSTHRPAFHQAVLFDASVSHDPIGKIVSYDWDFGDGTTQTGQKVHHAYQDIGDFTVRLTVKDNDGQTSTKEMALRVLDPAKPIIEAVLPQVGGIALEGISFENTYIAQVRSKTPLNKVIFRTGDRAFTDTDASDGWSAVIDSGILAGDSVLEVIAVDETGIESEPYTLRIRVVGLPEWLTHLIKLGDIDVSPEGRIRLAAKIPDPPVDVSLHLPDWIPVIGGEQRFKAGSKFYVIYEMPSGTAIIGGEGKLEITILGRSAAGRIGAKGTIDTVDFELEEATVWAYVEIEALSKRWEVEGIPVIGGFGFNVGISPHAKLAGKILADPTLKLDGTTISPGIKAAGKAKFHLGPAKVEIGARGNMTGNINIPAPYDPGVTASISAHGQVRAGWIRVGFEIEPIEYRYPGAAALFVPAEKVKVGDWEAVDKYGRTPLLGAEPLAQRLVTRTAAETIYGRLTMNNTEDETPALIHLGSGKYLVVWSAQDPAKDVWAGHDLFYSFYDASGWSAIKQLTDDHFDDRNPHLAKFGEEVNLVWTKVNKTFTSAEVETPLDIFPYYEIAHSIWDNAWSPAVLLTDDTALNFGVVAANGIIAWETDQDADLATTEDRSVNYHCLASGTYSEIPNASHPVLAGESLAYFDLVGQKVVLGKFTPALETVTSYPTTDFLDLAMTSYQDRYTLVWVDEHKLFSTNPFSTAPPETAANIETEGTVRTVDVMDFGNFQLLSFTGHLPGDPGQMIFYKIRYADTWVKQRTLAGGTDLTPWQASYAEGADGFLAVFAGKELLEDKNDIFYVFHRYAGDLELSATVTGEHSPGDNVTINYTVKNSGDQPIPAFAVTLYNLAMEELLTHSFNPLAPGANLSDTFTVTLDASGGFVLQAPVTPDLDPANNSVTLKLLPPDLLLKTVAESRQGEELTLTVTFENNGYTAAVGMEFELFSGAETLYSGVVDVPAEGSTTYTMTVNVAKINRSLVTGVRADPDNQIQEGNEENNLSLFRSLRADLSLEKEAIRAIQKGENILLSVLVKNEGTGDAAATLTLFDQEMNPVKATEFQIKGREKLAVFTEIEITLSPAEWHQVYFGAVDSIYGDKNDQDNITPLERTLLQLPTAAFTFDPSAPLVGQTISFDASQSHDDDGQLVQFIWNFGDDNILITEQPTIEHTYQVAGDYTVSLTVVDDSGLTGLLAIPVQVLDSAPQATITGQVRLPGRTNHQGANIAVIVAETVISVLSNADGHFTLTGIPAGEQTLVFFKERFLVKKLTVTVPETGTLELPEVATLKPGDANGDNEVNIQDLTLLASAYRTAEGDERYNAATDFNADGQVNIQDLTLLAGSYREVGDE